MKKILTIILMVCSVVSYAQSQKDVEKAHQFMSLYNYGSAISLLEKAMKKSKTDNPDVINALAECYYKVGNYQLAEQTYGRLVETGTAKAEDRKHYGETLMYFGKYEEAKKQLKNVDNDPAVKQMIMSCDSAMHWIAQGYASSYDVENESSLNTEGNELCARPIPGSRYIVFITDRSIGRKNDGMIRPYQSRAPSNGMRAAEISPLYANSHKGYNLGPLVYSSNGQKIIYTCNPSSDNKKVKADGLSIKEKVLIIEEATVTTDGQLTNVTPFDYNRPSEYSVTHPCLSPDGNILYFVSDKPGGYGGKDIYYSIRTANAWSIPMNAGPEINTAGDEMFPTMDENGTLYFSSNGRVGYGGLDIYKATGSKNEWKNVENMLAPINSSGDDFYLVFDDENSGYLTSNRPNGGSGRYDIYSFYTSNRRVITPKPKSTTIADVSTTTTTPSTGLTVVDAGSKINELDASSVATPTVAKYYGYVLEEGTSVSISEADIRVIDKKTNQSIYSTSNTEGYFALDLQPHSSYILSCTKEFYAPLTNYEFHTGDQQLRMNLRLQKEVQKPTTALVPVDYTNGSVDYRVQIQANSGIPDKTYWIEAQNAYPEYKIECEQFSDGLTRCTMGRFQQLKEANKLKVKLRALGYHDAFVVIYIDGQRKVVSYN